MSSSKESVKTSIMLTRVLDSPRFEPQLISCMKDPILNWLGNACSRLKLWTRSLRVERRSIATRMILRLN